jgi:hypothetical protein
MSRKYSDPVSPFERTYHARTNSTTLPESEEIKQNEDLITYHAATLPGVEPIPFIFDESGKKKRARSYSKHKQADS